MYKVERNEKHYEKNKARGRKDLNLIFPTFAYYPNQEWAKYGLQHGLPTN